MNKKETLKQLENIKDLMDCDIFYVDEDLVSNCLECDGSGENINYVDGGRTLINKRCNECDGSGIEEEYKDNLLSNNDMYEGITKAIKLIKEIK